MYSPSTKLDGKLKLRKTSLTLVMHLKLDFSSTVTRVTLEWLIYKKPKECKHWMLKNECDIYLHVFYSDELIPLFEFDYIFQIHTL